MRLGRRPRWAAASGGMADGASWKEHGRQRKAFSSPQPAAWHPAARSASHARWASVARPSHHLKPAETSSKGPE
jgi:hypothetical protein